MRDYGLWCRACRYQASVTAGTIFHKTKTPLLKWFWLIYRMATSKTSVSIAEMQRQLKIKDYKTIWAMAHKIRKGMADRDSHYRLAGLVEVDESFFGPRSSGKPGRGAERKSVVIVAVSTWLNSSGKEEPGFAHAFVAQDSSADSIEAILNRLTVPVNEVKPLITCAKVRRVEKLPEGYQETGSRSLPGHLERSERLHETLPWTHHLIANSKAVVSGPHRGVADKHLKYYLAGVCYRFNRRLWPEESLHCLLNACAKNRNVIHKALMAPNGAADQNQ